MGAGDITVYNPGSGYSVDDEIDVIGDHNTLFGTGRVQITSIADPEHNRQMGDIAYNHNSGMLMVSSTSGTFSASGATATDGHPNAIAICDPSSGTIYSSEPFNGGMTAMGAPRTQCCVGWDASSNIIVTGYTGSGDTSLFALNTQSGHTDGLTGTFGIISGKVIDLAEYISQPCFVPTPP